MTREEAIENWIKPACKNTWNEKKCKEIFKALEQEPIIDKIKVEIQHEQNMDYKCHRKTYDNCLRIIDKYRESEDKE